RLIGKPAEPLESRFAVTHGLILNVLQSEGVWPNLGYRKLVSMVMRSHENDYMRLRHLRTARTLFKSLVGAGIVVMVTDERAPVPRPALAPGLQRDFSLHHTLALYLYDTLPKLEPAAESYPLDIVTLVESILEDPSAVLYRQLDKLKEQKLEELKAQ